MDSGKNFLELFRKLIIASQDLMRFKASQDHDLKEFQKGIEQKRTLTLTEETRRKEEKTRKLREQLQRAEAIEKFWQQHLTTEGIEIGDGSSITFNQDVKQAFDQFLTANESVERSDTFLLLWFMVYQLQKNSRIDGIAKIIHNPQRISIQELGSTLYVYSEGLEELIALRKTLQSKLLSPHFYSLHKLPDYDKNTTESLNTTCIGVSPDGQIIATGTQDGRLFIWDKSTGMVSESEFKQNGIINKCSISLSGDIVCSTSDGVKVFQLYSKQQVTLSNNQSTCSSISADGQRVVWGDEEHLNIWSIEAPLPEHFAKYHNREIIDCAWSPNGRYLATGSKDNTLKIMDITTGNTLKTFFHSGWVKNCAWSSDSQYIASATDNNIFVWQPFSSDPESPMCVISHSANIRSCVWRSGQQWVVGIADDQSIRVWDIPTGECLTTLYTNGKLLACTVSDDDDSIVVASEYGIYWLNLKLN
jgi:hypothetical protein